MRYAQVGLLLMVCGALSAWAASPTVESASSSAARPDWCRAGFVCVPVAELVEDTRYKIELEAELARMKIRAKRKLDWHMGCGPGAGFVVQTDWDAKAAPIPLFCGAIYGW